MIQESPLSTFHSYPYRFVILIIYCLLAFANGMCWTIVSGISIPLARAYAQQDLTIAVIPLTFPFIYIFINFPANWIFQNYGIKKALVFGSILTTVGAGIRCLVNYQFWWMILGQLLCSIGQPFVCNCTSKISVRWFIVEERALAISILIMSNIAGSAAGFLIPALFVKETDPEEIIRSQFVKLLIVQLIIAFIPNTLIITLFKEAPPTPASVQSNSNSRSHFEQIKAIFLNSKFILISYAFTATFGVYYVYGSLLDQIIDCYGYSPDQVSSLGTIVTVGGIIFALLACAYIQKSRDFRRIFIILASLGIIVGVFFSFFLKKMVIQHDDYGHSHSVYGMQFYSYFTYFCRLRLRYSFSLMIKLWLQAVWHLLAVQQGLYQYLFVNTYSSQQNKQNSLHSIILINGIMISGLISYFFCNQELVRSNTQTKSLNQKIVYHNA